MILTERERRYIENLYGQEPEDLPDYEVEDTINELRGIY